jgi:hypothetical protein
MLHIAPMAKQQQVITLEDFCICSQAHQHLIAAVNAKHVDIIAPRDRKVQAALAEAFGSLSP